MNHQISCPSKVQMNIQSQFIIKKLQKDLIITIHIPILEYIKIIRQERENISFRFFSSVFWFLVVQLLIICPYSLLSTKVLCTRHEGFLINLHSGAKSPQKFLFAQLSNLGKSFREINVLVAHKTSSLNCRCQEVDTINQVEKKEKQSRVRINLNKQHQPNTHL